MARGQSPPVKRRAIPDDRGGGPPSPGIAGLEGLLAEAKSSLMACFRLFLIGASQPLEVDLPVRDVHALEALMSTAKFVTGTMAEPDEDGICPAFLVPTYRIQCVIEN
jgi:hypothetical protein